MMTAQHDPITPKWNAQIVLDHVPDRTKVIFKEIENAGHFSFLSPFPLAMKNENFLPSTDPPGFDREQFHVQLQIDILNFLNDKLYPKGVAVHV